MTPRLSRTLACLALVLGLLVGEVALAVSASAAPTARGAAPSSVSVPATAPAVVGTKKPTKAQEKKVQKTKAQRKAQQKAQRAQRREAQARQAAAARAAALARERAWTPRDATYFNYPTAKRAADRFRIRNTILSAVKASPAGSSIRMSTFTFIDATITKALVAAHRRGVSVQVLVNRSRAKASKPFRSLAKVLNKRPKGTVVNPDTSSARTCDRSCRGTGGNQHTKLYLFSQVGHAGFVSMIASANLTRFAAVGQWNHLDVSLGRATYTRLRGVFDQMTLDAPSPFLSFMTKKLQAWVFPRPGSTPANDPVAASLRQISCIGPAPRTTRAQARQARKDARRIRALPPRRQARAQARAARVAAQQAQAVAARRAAQKTSIRIGMYAWHDKRGTALARLVRQRSDQGCDVRIVYSFASPQVMRILRAKGGQGPIPMRRSVTHHGSKVADYNHSKYVAVDGTWNNTRGQQVWTGSMNFTPLGFASDDIVVRFPGARTYASYLANFERVWRARTSTRPSRA